MAHLVEGHPDKIALLGVRPGRAETGYGSIVRGPRVEGSGAAFRVGIQLACKDPSAAPSRGSLRKGAVHEGGCRRSGES